MLFKIEHGRVFDKIAYACASFSRATGKRYPA